MRLILVIQKGDPLTIATAAALSESARRFIAHDCGREDLKISVEVQTAMDSLLHAPQGVR